MDLQWTVYVQRRGAHDVVPLGIFQRPVTDATVADFGLSIAEGRELLAALQQVVAQDQIRAYDAERRCCRLLDWFHLGMKLHAVKSPLCARTSPLLEKPVFMVRCERLLRRVRDALWRGRGETAIEMVRTLIASLKQEIGLLPRFYGLCASTAVGAATSLLTFPENNRTI